MISKLVYSFGILVGVILLFSRMIQTISIGILFILMSIIGFSINFYVWKNESKKTKK